MRYFHLLTFHNKHIREINYIPMHDWLYHISSDHFKTSITFYNKQQSEHAYDLINQIKLHRGVGWSESMLVTKTFSLVLTEWYSNMLLKLFHFVHVEIQQTVSVHISIGKKWRLRLMKHAGSQHRNKLQFYVIQNEHFFCKVTHNVYL